MTELLTEILHADSPIKDLSGEMEIARLAGGPVCCWWRAALNHEHPQFVLGFVEDGVQERRSVPQSLMGLFLVG